MNPIKKIREKEGITREELAMAADVSYTTVVNIERGRAKKVNEDILDVLEELGCNRNEIEDEYNTFREECRKEILK